MQTDWVFWIFLTLRKEGKLQCGFFGGEHLKGVFPFKKIQFQRLLVDTLKQVCKDIYFQSRNFLN